MFYMSFWLSWGDWIINLPRSVFCMDGQWNHCVSCHLQEVRISPCCQRTDVSCAPSLSLFLSVYLCFHSPLMFKLQCSLIKDNAVKLYLLKWQLIILNENMACKKKDWMNKYVYFFILNSWTYLLCTDQQVIFTCSPQFFTLRSKLFMHPKSQSTLILLNPL